MGPIPGKTDWNGWSFERVFIYYLYCDAFISAPDPPLLKIPVPPLWLVACVPLSFRLEMMSLSTGHVLFSYLKRRSYISRRSCSNEHFKSSTRGSLSTCFLHFAFIVFALNWCSLFSLFKTSVYHFLCVNCISSLRKIFFLFTNLRFTSIRQWITLTVNSPMALNFFLENGRILFITTMKYLSVYFLCVLRGLIFAVFTWFGNNFLLNNK